jgi:FkbM family methyltransferase
LVFDAHSRVKNSIHAISNARRFGLSYRRARDFTMPDSLRLLGKEVGIKHLDSPGTRSDFFVCLIYDRYKLKELSRVGLPIIVDVGANQGFFALAARAHNPTARIMCYEPNAQLEEILRHNCSVSGAEPVLEAVGRQRGFCRLNLQHESNLTTTEPISEGETGVPVSTLSDVVERAGGQISLLKLDCEGAEWEILESDAVAHVNAISMEYHLGKSSSASHKSVPHFMKRLGFSVLHFAPGDGTGDVVAVRPPDGR